MNDGAGVRLRSYPFHRWQFKFPCHHPNHLQQHTPLSSAKECPARLCHHIRNHLPLSSAKECPARLRHTRQLLRKPLTRCSARIHNITTYALCPNTATISTHNHRRVLSWIVCTMHRLQSYHGLTLSPRMSHNAVSHSPPTTAFPVSHSNTTLRGYVAYNKTILPSNSWTVGLTLSSPTIPVYSETSRTSHRLQSLSHLMANQHWMIIVQSKASSP